MNIFKTVALGLVFVALATLDSGTSNFFTPRVSAQILGVPAAKVGNGQWKNVLAAFPEEPPLAIFAWGKAGALNPTGNPSEQWFAQEELQTMFKKIKSTASTAAANSREPVVAAWLEGPLWEILEKGGMLALEDIDFTERRPLFSFVSHKFEGCSIEELLEIVESTYRYKEIKIGEDVVHEAVGENATLAIGFHGDHLIMAMTKELWEKVAKRIDAGQRAPEWARKLFGNQPIRRLSNFGYINVAKFRQRLASSEDPDLIEAVTVIDRLGIESVQSKQGTDDISNLSIIQVVGDKTGLLSSIDTAPLTVDQLKEFPNDCTVAMGIKLSPENILELVQKFFPDKPIGEQKPMKDFEREFGFNLQADVLDHLEGDLRGFSSGSIIKPMLVGVVGIKDQSAFQPIFAAINEKLEEQVTDSGGEFIEKTGRDGITVYGVKNPYGTSVYWALHESELLFGSNNRAIGSFVRKRAKRESSLTDQPLIAEILKSPPSESLGPVAFQVTDMNQILEALLPMAGLALNFIPPEAGIDISGDDIPSPEVLVGLRPNAMVGFKTEEGATMISRYDSPISIESSYGVLIGMLLPAVQQVREAARRTQTLNNIRQLALAAHNFASVNQRFPAAFSADEDGKPLLSWRVHLLPYIEQQELYEQFNLDEPWDSPNNIKLLDQMPDLFKSLSASIPDGHTMLLTPVTEASIFSQTPEDGRLGAGFADITDGTSNTMMIVQGGAKNAVPWTSPQDLNVEDLADINFDSGHPGTFCVALGDGSTHSVSKQMDVDEFVSACVMNDGEAFEP